MDIKQQIELIRRGTTKIYSEEELIKKIDKTQKTGKPLNIKLGIDPTMSEIHLGHTILIRKLSVFQRLGHNIILIIGDFTARIGDPSGRDKTRPPLDLATIEKNKNGLFENLKAIIDVNKVTIRYNSEWLSKINLTDLITISSNLTIAKILEREDFKNRYVNNIPITLTEILYPILQAMDSVEIKADVELGGQDQTYNLLLGRDLQEFFGQEPQVCLTMPLLVGLDGTKKMSKTYLNTILVKDEPFEMFSKVMSIPDELMEHYFLLLTEIDESKVKQLCNPNQTHPKVAKEELAKAIVKSYYNEEEARKAQEKFTSIFSKKEIPDDIPIFKTEDDKMRLIDILVKSNMCKSNSEAKTLIKQGAVELDGQKIEDITVEISKGKEQLLKVGKKNRFLKIL